MRQRVRKTMLIVSFLLFPVTIWYFSPYLIIQAASEHIMNGSFIVFSAMFVLPALIHGRRATCHYICWMAPFMVIGSVVGRFLNFPQLHIEADKNMCIACGKCSKSCLMGLNVKEMVSEGKNANCTECIQCGACIDACPKKVLKYRVTWRRG